MHMVDSELALGSYFLRLHHRLFNIIMLVEGWFYGSRRYNYYEQQHRRQLLTPTIWRQLARINALHSVTVSVGLGGALEESMPVDWRVVNVNPALAAT